MEQPNEKRICGLLVRGINPAMRSLGALVTIAALLCTSGCGSVAKTVGMGLMATGGAAAVTTGFLGAGCSTPNPVTNRDDEYQPCLPPQTYDDYKPMIWGTFVTGLIMFAAGVAVYATAIESEKSTPARTKSPAKDSLEEEKCTDPKYCY